MQTTEMTPEALAAAAFDECGNAILRLAFSYLHNRQDAEDILQETILQLIRAKPVLETPAHRKAWLLTVTANKSKNLLKYNRYRMHGDVDELTLAAEMPAEQSNVWQAVNALPEKYREVIHLFYAEDYSTSEIAKILGKREPTVRSLLCRGREKLKAVLKEAYDFAE